MSSEDPDACGCEDGFFATDLDNEFRSVCEDTYSVEPSYSKLEKLRIVSELARTNLLETLNALCSWTAIQNSSVVCSSDLELLFDSKGLEVIVHEILSNPSVWTKEAHISFQSLIFNLVHDSLGSRLCQYFDNLCSDPHRDNVSEDFIQGFAEKLNDNLRAIWKHNQQLMAPDAFLRCITDFQSASKSLSRQMQADGGISNDDLDDRLQNARHDAVLLLRKTVGQTAAEESMRTINQELDNLLSAAPVTGACQPILGFGLSSDFHSLAQEQVLLQGRIEEAIQRKEHLTQQLSSCDAEITELNKLLGKVARKVVMLTEFLVEEPSKAIAEGESLADTRKKRDLPGLTADNKDLAPKAFAAIHAFLVDEINRVCLAVDRWTVNDEKERSFPEQFKIFSNLDLQILLAQNVKQHEVVLDRKRILSAYIPETLQSIADIIANIPIDELGKFKDSIISRLFHEMKNRLKGSPFELPVTLRTCSWLQDCVDRNPLIQSSPGPSITPQRLEQAPQSADNNTGKVKPRSRPVNKRQNTKNLAPNKEKVVSVARMDTQQAIRELEKSTAAKRS